MTEAKHIESISNPGNREKCLSWEVLTCDHVSVFKAVCMKGRFTLACATGMRNGTGWLCLSVKDWIIVIIWAADARYVPLWVVWRHSNSRILFPVAGNTNDAGEQPGREMEDSREEVKISFSVETREETVKLKCWVCAFLMPYWS